jgi:hypothetical protein
VSVDTDRECLCNDDDVAHCTVRFSIGPLQAVIDEQAVEMRDLVERCTQLAVQLEGHAELERQK